MPAGAVDYEREYDNRGRVPEHPAIIEGWYAAAAAARRELRGELDRAYGAHPRERFDLFEPDAAAAGAAVLFVHGGYWQALEKAAFSHLARGALAHGLPVAVAGYPLCPEVPLARIVEALRAAVPAVAAATGRRVVVCGHSAGGHLAAAMVATHWERRDLVPAGLAISGLFDLEPLVHTSINGALGLDAPTARALSPVRWPAPARRAFDCWVGAEESDEYHRQSRDLVRFWGEAGVDTESEVVPGADHFTVVGALADPASRLTRRLAALARRAA
jgi:arylformamidase